MTSEPLFVVALLFAGLLCGEGLTRSRLQADAKVILGVYRKSFKVIVSDNIDEVEKETLLKAELKFLFSKLFILLFKLVAILAVLAMAVILPWFVLKGGLGGLAEFLMRIDVNVFLLLVITVYMWLRGRFTDE